MYLKYICLHPVCTNQIKIQCLQFSQAWAAAPQRPRGRRPRLRRSFTPSTGTPDPDRWHWHVLLGEQWSFNGYLCRNLKSMQFNVQFFPSNIPWVLECKLAGRKLVWLKHASPSLAMQSLSNEWSWFCGQSTDFEFFWRHMGRPGRPGRRRRRLGRWSVARGMAICCKVFQRLETLLESTWRYHMVYYEKAQDIQQP